MVPWVIILFGIVVACLVFDVFQCSSVRNLQFCGKDTLSKILPVVRPFFEAMNQQHQLEDVRQCSIVQNILWKVDNRASCQFACIEILFFAFSPAFIIYDPGSCFYIGVSAFNLSVMHAKVVNTQCNVQITEYWLVVAEW